jgi:elongation factor G
MSVPEATQIRNFALIGHGGDGKTTLADSLAMAAGVSNRLGSVQDGSSFMNYLPEEKTRRITIALSICSFDRDGRTFTVIDTPGDANFAGEMLAALQAVDHAVLVVSAAEGMKVGAEKAIAAARARGLTLSAVANKMDHERADLDACAEALGRSLERRIVKLHLPIGSGPSFEGYVDLLAGKAYRYPADGSGQARVGDVPAELAAECEAARAALVEAVAEADDAMVEKYLEQGSLSDEEVLATLRKGVNEGTLVPLLCAASARNVGGAALIDAAARFFPSAAERPPRSAREGENLVELASDPAAPLAAQVFKSVADRYAGMLSIFRVVSGTLSTDSTIANARTGTRERVSKILRLHGETTSDLKEVGPGGIAALAKLRDTRTGDTLCGEKRHLALPAVEPPRGVISFAVEAANKGEEDKVFDSLNRLVAEDPSLHLGRDPRTHEFLISGLGQLHIEVTLERLRRMFHAQVHLKPPRVPYLETITGRAENVEGKLKKQSGGRGQFGVCYLTVEPGPRGSGVDFIDDIVGGSIPRQFIPAVEKGVRDACERGIVAGYPLTDVRIHCIDGKYHSVDSSEQAFKTAGSLGIKAAVRAAKPTLLEPVMHVEVVVPDEFVGDVMGNLNGRRGRVAGVDTRGSMQLIKAQVPMAEMLTYAPDLTSMTGGKGSFSMEFSHYEEAPAPVREKIVAGAAKDREEEE